MVKHKTKAWSRDVVALKDPFIEELVSETSAEIEAAARTHKIDPRYLQIQARLHVPYYPEERRTEAPNPDMMRQVLDRITARLPDMEDETIFHRRSCGIDYFPSDSFVSGSTSPVVRSLADSSFQVPIRFGAVDPEFGIRIQKSLHYIHAPRNDSIGHFGFFLPDRSEPFCYAALSLCDREYQLTALRNIFPDIPMKSVLNMTRAYSFPPLPKNTMSKFFNMIAQHYSAQRQFLAIITALNPLLGFKGSTFLGSSFIPFATSPMQYWYNGNGEYVNRRSNDPAKRLQGMHTPPILWLARGLTRTVQRRLDGNQELYIVSEEQYGNG